MNSLKYIGSAGRSILKRWTQHKSVLRKRKHHSRRLQFVYNKYGLDALVFQAIENCIPEELLVAEQRYLSGQPRRSLYNTNPKAGSRLGARVSRAVRARMIKIRGGITDTRTRKKIAAAYKRGASQTNLARQYGLDRATIRNYLIALKVEPRSPRAKQLGFIKTILKEYRANVPAVQIARAHQLDVRTLRKIVEANGCRWRNGSERQKLRFAKEGALEALSASHGSEKSCFIHRKHGLFCGYPFEFAKRFGLKSRGTISLMIGGKVDSYRGWEMSDGAVPHRWKSPEVRTYPKGKNHQFFGKRQTEAARKKISLRLRRLSDAHVSKIRDLLTAGVKQQKVAKMFRVDQSVVSRITTRSRNYAN